MVSSIKNKSSNKNPLKRGSGGIINTLINKIPFEAHLPGYNYCGPGTKLKKRLARGDKGVNELDEACREHDIAYSQSKDIGERHSADKILAEKAWKRVKASDSKFGEKVNAFLVTSAMKAKVKLGTGPVKKTKHKPKTKKSLKKIIQEAKTAIKGYKLGEKDAINIALKAARTLNRKRSKQSIKIPRVIPVPKTGGILPLIPIFAGLSAIGALSGGAAGITKAVNDAKNASEQLKESARHNKTMEAIALRGNGLHLKPYKQGLGLYLKPKNL